LNGLSVELGSLIVSIVAVFGAGIIRGYSGFGFAMVAVTSMSLVLPPAQVVPTVLVLEVLASLRLVPQVRKDIDWYSLRWLLLGSLVGIPFGVYLLATIPPAPMRIFISLMVLIASILLMRGFSWKRMPGIILILITGLACGMLNGAAAIGGPPVILFYLSSPAGVKTSRASIIAYFLGIDTLCLICLSGTIAFGYYSRQPDVCQDRSGIFPAPCADPVDIAFNCRIFSIDFFLTSGGPKL
jgi:uncharacterized membrane protein YfcA